MATYRFIPRTYDQCSVLFQTRAKRHNTMHSVAVGLGHQTRLVRANNVAEGAYAIEHFASRVLVFHPDGLLTVGTGGYATVSTTERLNTFSPDGLSFRRLAGQKHLFPAEIGVWTSGKPHPLLRFQEGDRETATLRQVSAEDDTWMVVS